MNTRREKTMTAQKLVRWSGLLPIITAVLLRMGRPNLLGWVFSFLFSVFLVFAVIGRYEGLTI